MMTYGVPNGKDHDRNPPLWEHVTELTCLLQGDLSTMRRKQLVGLVVVIFLIWNLLMYYMLVSKNLGIYPYFLSLSLTLSLSLYLSISLSLSLSLCVSPSVALSFLSQPSRSLPKSLSLSFFLCLSICLSVCLSISLTPSLSLCLFLSLSLCLFLSLSLSYK